MTRSLSIAALALITVPLLSVVTRDWLMPAELFPMAFFGAMVLIVSAVRVRRYKVPATVGLALCVGALAIGVPAMRGASGSSARQILVAVLVGYLAGLVVLVATGVLVVAASFASLPEEAARDAEAPPPRSRPPGPDPRDIDPKYLP